MSKIFKPAPSCARHQRGVTLIVAMVMLVIIGLTSAAVMRGALSADLVANNGRVQALAQQAAQIGLRYCESEIPTPTTITIQPAAATVAAQAWRTFGNWGASSTVSSRVPAGRMASADSSFTPSRLPECLVEQGALPNTYIVTSRGFSPDYAEDGSHRTQAGSVVWLQSYVAVGP